MWLKINIIEIRELELRYIKMATSLNQVYTNKITHTFRWAGKHTIPLSC